MSNFITNSSTKVLRKRILELISKSEELKFLIAFFYFSGLQELYEGLKKNHDVLLKVLVGLNVDKTIHGFIEYGSILNNYSDEERVHQFFQSIKNSINTEQFDNKEFYEQVRFFIGLIKNNRLIIRRTYEPNHAKLYIFKLEKAQVGRKTLFITGSSNLTSSGLTRQHEFNVEISDYGFEEADKYFDVLWSTAVRITEDDATRNKLIKLLEQETLIKELTPFEAYVLVLKNYLDSFRGKALRQRLEDLLEERGYKRYQYQLDAIKQALAIIEEYNGVIIADVVGLGKTVIACAVAFELNKRGIVIAPPGLIGDQSRKSGWRKYLEDFHLSTHGWDAFSLGDLEKVEEFLQSARDVEVVIIDEAHRFRNQDTIDYEHLRNICRGKTVILLTATPFNNRPADIFSLLKLFVIPKKSKITLSNNLEARFDLFKTTFNKLAYIKRYHNSSESSKRNKAAAYYKALFGTDKINLLEVKNRARVLAREIKDVIEPVTIRRNRLDLQENPYYKEEVKELSRVNNPKEWFYELTKTQLAFYDTVINDYFALPDEGGIFTGAIYQPFNYEKGLHPDRRNDDDLTEEESFQSQQQFNLYDFMRRLLVKRFESSFGAFKESVENFKYINTTVLEFIQKTKKYILDRSLLMKIYEKELGEIEDELKKYAESLQNNEYSKNHKIYVIEKFKLKTKFLSDIKRDIELFDQILSELTRLRLVKNDPKAKCLIKNIKAILKKDRRRKIVIFSEYIATVTHLTPLLQRHFNNRVLVVPGELSASKIREIHENFDASYHVQKDDYDILLTTDKISEGFNLNRAGMVINYDIPWNPVRVIQRVGRINRISKKVFDELYIVNFFPSEKGSDLVRSREIASNKMFLIHNALGEDARIFDIDEEPTPSGLYKRIQQNPDELEKESFYTSILKEFEQIKQQYPELIQSLHEYPPRIKVAKRAEENELIVVIKKGRLYVHYKKLDAHTPALVTSIENVYEKIKADPSDQALPLSNKFWDEYEQLKHFPDSERTHLAENSLQLKAINMLKALINHTSHPELTPYKNFLRMLLEDILDYGTLSDYTLRRITNLKSSNIAAVQKEIKELRRTLGDNYLYKEKERLKEFTRDIIIAIENRSHGD